MRRHRVVLSRRLVPRADLAGLRPTPTLARIAAEPIPHRDLDDRESHDVETPASARVVRANVTVRERVAQVWRYRELLVGMTRRELKVKYKNSVLGFAWSMLNPLMIMVVYYFAFQVVLKAGIPQFPFYLLCGVLVWNLFSGGLTGATVSMVTNSALVKKVAFPREVLPLAAVGAAGVHFLLQGSVLLVALAVFRHAVAWKFMLLLLPASLAIIFIAAALGLMLSAINAYLRDTQHIVDLVLVAWFWATPVVYSYGQVVAQLKHTWIRVLYLLNPVTPIVLTFQRALYARVSTGTVTLLPVWNIGRFAILVGAELAVSIALLALGFKVFGRLEGNIAEEL